ncbi:MAG: galactose-1-phosphate uridylyltransferase [Bryobacteraceae bacterium]
MSELRWHPFLGQWVSVATHRQNRPQLPRNWCPFCPGSGRVPDQYGVLIYPNDYPALDPPGGCDVLLYSSDHSLKPSDMTGEQWRAVVDLWAARCGELEARPGVAYVGVFENQGEAVGVTMPHPHGQIYAFPFEPAFVAIERARAAAAGRCIGCDVVAEEASGGALVIARSDHFVAFAPSFGRFPTETHIAAREHREGLSELSPEERADLASLIRVMRRKYDRLYGFPMPLMMVVQQATHLRIEFLPLQRSADKLKYLASCESGYGTYLNDTRSDETAERMRKIDAE